MPRSKASATLRLAHHAVPQDALEPAAMGSVELEDRDLAHRLGEVGACRPRGDIERGRLIGHRELADIAADIGATPSQLALAWVLRHPGVIAIPKAESVGHVRENHAAADLVIPPDTLARLDAASPAPRARVSLEML